jgi:cytosine permease
LSDEGIVRDDYALQRVPPNARYGWATVAVQRFGLLSALSQFLLGATLGMGMTFWDAVLGQGLAALLGGPPVWVWSVLGGLVITAIVVHGFAGMAWTAWITVPAFLALAGWAIAVELAKQPLGDLVASAPPGPVISLAQGATLVAGGFIVGATISPDMCRFNRSAADVVKQTIVGITLGE